MSVPNIEIKSLDIMGASNPIVASKSEKDGQCILWLAGFLHYSYARTALSNRIPLHTKLVCRLTVPEFNIEFEVDRAINLETGQLFGENSIPLSMPLGSWIPIAAQVPSKAQLLVEFKESAETIKSAVFPIICL